MAFLEWYFSFFGGYSAWWQVLSTADVSAGVMRGQAWPVSSVRCRAEGQWLTTTGGSVCLQHLRSSGRPWPRTLFHNTEIIVRFLNIWWWWWYVLQYFSLCVGMKALPAFSVYRIARQRIKTCHHNNAKLISVIQPRIWVQNIYFMMQCEFCSVPKFWHWFCDGFIILWDIPVGSNC